MIHVKFVLQGIIKRASAVDLAPAKVQKRKPLSERTTGTVPPRHREIGWKCEKKLEVLEVCNNKIIIGWDNGQIKIYNSADLRCQTVLNYCFRQSKVTCLQCTCTEIIAGYQDGNLISVWNIQRQFLVCKLAIAEGSYPTCMRWREPKLVVGTNKGVIHIWQNVSSTFTMLGSWAADKSEIFDVDFNEDYVIVEPLRESEPVIVHYFNGHQFRRLSMLTLRMTLLQETNFASKVTENELKLILPHAIHSNLSVTL